MSASFISSWPTIAVKGKMGRAWPAGVTVGWGAGRGAGVLVALLGGHGAKRLLRAAASFDRARTHACRCVLLCFRGCRWPNQTSVRRTKLLQAACRTGDDPNQTHPRGWPWTLCCSRRLLQQRTLRRWSGGGVGGADGQCNASHTLLDRETISPNRMMPITACYHAPQRCSPSRSPLSRSPSAWHGHSPLCRPRDAALDACLRRFIDQLSFASAEERSLARNRLHLPRNSTLHLVFHKSFQPSPGRAASRACQQDA